MYFDPAKNNVCNALKCDTLRAPSPLGPGDYVVITPQGVIREATPYERERGCGRPLPAGATIEGCKLNVPAWWWWLNVGEMLGEEMTVYMPPPMAGRRADDDLLI